MSTESYEITARHYEIGARWRSDDSADLVIICLRCPTQGPERYPYRRPLITVNVEREGDVSLDWILEVVATHDQAVHPGHPPQVDD
jgi:hypothetical protein